MKNLLCAAFVTVAVCGCTSNEAPKCSDASTIELVKKIILDKGVSQGVVKEEDRADVESRMTISAIRTTDINEKTGMKKCAASVSVSREGREPWERDITYTSEVTDDLTQQVVTIYGLSLR